MIALALLLAVAPAASCATPAPLPAPLAGWSVPSTSRRLEIGRPMRLALSKAHVAAATTKRAPPGTAGGSAAFTVERGGTYEVASSEAAWIDVIGQSAAIASIAHRHGTPCTPIRKIVSFALAPGEYTLQISGATTARATVAITRAK